MLILVVALLATQADAGPAADAGPVADAGPPPSLCGSLTDEGACFNGAAAFCSVPNDDGEDAAADLLVEDCGEGACALLDGLGAWCFAPAGAPCAFEAGERASTHACGPAGALADPAWGCDLVEGCVALTSAGCGDGCADAAHLRLGCAPFGQPVLFSCAAFSGTCEGTGCVALGAGAPCDERLLCAGELRCLAGRCVAEQPGAAVDAGPAEAPPPPAPAPLCGAGAGASGPLLAGLLWALGVSRRGRRPARSAPLSVLLSAPRVREDRPDRGA